MLVSKHALIILLTLGQTNAFSQSNTIVTSSEHLSNFSSSILEKNTIELLDNNSIIPDDEKKVDPDAQFIKDWLALTTYLTILPLSYHSSLDEERKAVYIEAQAMFLEGENITKKDIKLYELNH